MNPIVVGKRIPIGAAVNGVVVSGAWYYNLDLPIEAQISVLAIGGIGAFLTALVQMIVVNYFGITQPTEK